MSLNNNSNPLVHPDVKKHFDGTNLTAFESTISHILVGRGVDGYRTGDITCPATPAPSDPTPTATDWDSLTPSFAEWHRRDHWVRSTMALNITDIVELDVNDKGTAKVLWDSITAKYRQKSSMAIADAKEKLSEARYVMGTPIVDHYKALRRLRRAVVDAGGTVTDDDQVSNIIRSLPDELQFIKPTLYTLDKINDVEQLITLNIKSPSTPIDPFALAARTVCTNPNCRRTGHLIADCYWVGGGKEGQFPPNFGNRHAPATATMATSTDIIVHRVL